MPRIAISAVVLLLPSVLCAGVETERIYLSGRGCDDAVAWGFSIDRGRRAGEATTIPVPSCWEAQGFGVAQYGFNLRCPEAKYRHGNDPVSAETGIYRHAFDFRKTDGTCVELVFEAVFTDCEVRLNGTLVGTHQGGFQTFRFDVTDAIRDGRNELVVTVRKESANESVNFAERRGDYWVFGGIWRPVYLEVLPRTHIDRLTIVAGADGVLDARLYANDGTVQTIVERYDRPKLWTAETPHLYTRTFALTNAAGEVVHQVTKRFGFRTVEPRGRDGLWINGRRVFVKGVNRHSFRPETGRTLSRAKNLEDVRLIRSMNMNAVRLAHYQADPEFLDLCDEYGLYVENELTGWQATYDDAIGRKLVAEMVTRDQTHPSVIWWSNGNEGGFNPALDGEFAKWDPSGRSVLHPWAEFGGYQTKHYRNYGETLTYLDRDGVFLPTEFQHGLYDGGHAAGL
ncbi:MAG: glycoside hydrolase family 2 protein, partial [Kiritimatiellia bacterium]